MSTASENPMSNKVHPTLVSMDEAIAMINTVVAKGTNHDFSLPKRVGHTTVMSICCTPCVLWSSVWRCLCCPIQCFTAKHVKGNPIGALFTDSPCTNCSDKCISESYTAIYKKNKIKNTTNSTGVILYAATKISDPNIPVKTKYAIVDLISPILPFATSLTPQGVLKHADSLT